MKLRKFNRFDFLVLILIAIAVIVGILTFNGERKTSSKQIENEGKVAIEVYFRGITVTSNNSPFTVGDETFITVRNVPYTNLKITDVKYDRKQVIVPSHNPKGYVLVDDASLPYQYDFLVTVIDDAKLTKNKGGAVVGGNKIKIGLPITLEGADYRFNGLVSNITIISDTVKENKN